MYATADTNVVDDTACHAWSLCLSKEQPQHIPNTETDIVEQEQQSQWQYYYYLQY